MILIIGGTGPFRALSAGEKNIFPFLYPSRDGRLSETDAELLSHPSDVSIGLLSCNNLISQCHTSAGLWQHLMSVALFSSVSNFMTSPLFCSMACSGLWTCNDNWERKQSSAQLCTKSFCQGLKLQVCAYDCVYTGLTVKIIIRRKLNLEIFSLLCWLGKKCCSVFFFFFLTTVIGCGFLYRSENKQFLTCLRKGGLGPIFVRYMKVQIKVRLKLIQIMK